MKINPVLSTPAPSVGDVWDHLLPLGRFPGQAREPGGKKYPVYQISTNEQVQLIATAFNRRAEKDSNWPGLMLDIEHNSIGDEGSTESATWYRNFEVRSDGLYGQAERTSLGQEKISGKIYKRISPETILEPIKGTEKDFLIIGLNSAALTNKPNMHGMRLLASNRADGATCEFFEIEPEPRNAKMLTKDNLSILGLTEDADTDAVNAAVVALNKRATESETKLTAIEADDFAETNAAKFKGGKDQAKTMFCENRATAEAIAENAVVPVTAVATKEDPEKKPVVLNREDTKTPEGSVTAVGEDTESKAESEKYLRVQNRASEIVSKDKIPFNAAWNKALAEEK